MNKKILIIASGYSKESTDPCCKEINKWISKLSSIKKNYTFIVLTSCNKKSSKNVICYHIDKYNDLYSKIERLVSQHSFIGKIANHLFEKRALINIKRAYNYGHVPYFMDQDKFEKWVENHNALIQNIDFVFSFSNPFYQHEYSLKIIEKNNNIIWFSFFYDPFSDSFNCKEPMQAIERESKIFQRTDRIFALKEIIDNCKNSQIRLYSSKLNILPNTTIVNKTVSCNDDIYNEGEDYRLFCSGRFDKTIRNPQRMLNILGNLPENFKTVFYSAGCDDLIRNACQKSPDSMANNGFSKKQTEYEKKLSDSDVLLIVGNSITNQIPSKFVEYISFGKPIIYFQSIDNDHAIEKYGKYPLLLIISNKISIDEAVSQIKSFCQRNRSKMVSYDEIVRLFSSDTIDYFIEKLIREIDDCYNSDLY